MLLRFNDIIAILIGLTSATDAFNNSSNCSQYVILFLPQIDTGELLNYTNLDGHKRHAYVYNGKRKQQQLPLVVWLHGALISPDFGIQQRY
ncbi:unnamed protein product [Rotaria sp. Silwood1]|nr:unnamed protein product [Rotaria sp. Silwood1]CAF4539234.1 unnamed protein product [Rotaria sp. Silwood1]CAF4631670.1 unnamed protein product [Rotaria sp. Silwood1]